MRLISLYNFLCILPRFRQLSILLLVLGLILLLQPTLLAQEQQAPPPPIAPGKQGEMEKIKLTEIQDGVKKWILTADNADYLKDKDRIHINNVWVEIFGKEPEKETDDVIITGDKGFIGVKSRDLTLEGNVRAKTAEYEFTSEFQGPRLYMEGKQLTVDLRQNKLDVAQHTVTKLQLSGRLWKF
jgi:LPS export ABC transporter protein LptC